MLTTRILKRSQLYIRRSDCPSQFTWTPQPLLASHDWRVGQLVARRRCKACSWALVTRVRGVLCVSRPRTIIPRHVFRSWLTASMTRMVALTVSSRSAEAAVAHRMVARQMASVVSDISHHCTQMRRRNGLMCHELDSFTSNPDIRLSSSLLPDFADLSDSSEDDYQDVFAGIAPR
jgi:hypothetical protein